MVKRPLLACGLVAPALYGVMNFAGPMRYPGYSSISQTFSELGAIGAPSRSVVFPLTMAYDALCSPSAQVSGTRPAHSGDSASSAR